MRHARLPASSAVSPTSTPAPAALGAGGAAPPRSLRLVRPYPCVPDGLSGVGLDLCAAIQGDPRLREQFAPEFWVSDAVPAVRRPFLRGYSHPWLSRLAYRLRGGERLLRQRLLRRLLATVRPGDVLLLFPGLEAGELQALRDRGATLVLELCNTSHQDRRTSLAAAYTAAGLPPRGLADDDAVARERALWTMADLAFVCSPLVEQSARDLGLPAEKLLRTSYGFDPAQFRPQRTPGNVPTFLFAGGDSVRKGLPVLLQAWAAAQLPARLLVVGDLDPLVADRYGAMLRGGTVEVVPYQRDLAPLYGRADVFVLPSFEEGSPLVSYLALAAGLPQLLSPAAAGWVVRDGEEGLVIPPDDVAAWTRALQRLAADAALRQRLGAAAARRSADYRWPQVAVQRCAVLQDGLARLARR